jgi:ferredoxin--NADP+ reductase
VVSQERIAADTYLLSFEPADRVGSEDTVGSAGFFEPAGIFEPGAIVGLALHPAGPSRWYSLAGGPAEGVLQVVFDVVPGGALTPALAALRPGDRLWASAPGGEFRDPGGRALWLAAGTGIAPFRSMVRAGRTAGKTLVHAARTRDSFLFAPEFAAAASAGAGRDAFRYVRCASRDAGEGLYPGRLTEYLSRVPELPEAERCLVCGSADFVVDVRDILIARGIPFEAIVSETYF